MSRGAKLLSEYSLYAAWAMALIATGLSLYLSEGAHLLPCVLCWYQRICMYPLVLILGAGILRRDKNVLWYGLPLAVIGAVIALYHSLLQWHLVSEAYAPCVGGVSCGDVQLVYLHIFTIPFGSFLSFMTIIGLITVNYRLNSRVSAQQK